MLATGSVAHAQVLQQYLPDVTAPAYGQAGPAIAPDVTATLRGAVETQPSDTVLTREHPEYDAQGVHVGDFYVRPKLEESLGYDSNLFTDNSGRGAFQITTAPSVSFASDWALNSLQGGLTVNNTVYPTQSNQNFTNVNGNIGGAYDIGLDRLQIDYSHASTHIARGTIAVGDFDRPIPFDIDDINASYLVPLARLSFEPQVDFFNIRFSNGTFRHRTVLDSVNDRNVVQPTLTTRYDLAPLRSLVLVLSGNSQNFYRAPSLNSKSGEVLGGIDFNLNAVFRIRALAGYEVRTFTYSAFKTRSAPVIDASVVWLPTELTNVTLRANRSIEDALSTATTNGFTYTSVKLSVDHELYRNVRLNAYVQIEQADLTANQGSTTIYTTGGSATWLLNRRLSLTGRFVYADRQASHTQGSSYSQIILAVGLGFRL